MKPLVYQVVIGEVNSKTLKRCIKSVKDYASRMGYDYQCDTEFPDWAQGMLPGTASEWMRIDKMTSKPKIMYVDWDFEILKDFELKDDIITVPSTDTLMYYGVHIDIAKRVKIEMGERKKYTQQEYNEGCYGMGHRAFVNIFKNYDHKFLSRDNYRHFKYHLRPDI